MGSSSPGLPPGARAQRTRAQANTCGRLALCVIGALCIESSLGAEPVPAEASASEPLEEVLVTARKRPETLQSVPLSAAVVSGSFIADQGILSVQDLTYTLPAVKLAKGSTTNRQFIRGIGSGDNPSFEQSVGTFVDDVYHGRARSSESGLFDIERVEVLRGPQTTYFGNNAIAGALNVTTRDPGQSFSGDARLSYTNDFDAYAAEAGIDVPVATKFAVRLAGQATGGDGWIEDVGAGEELPHTRNSGARVTMLWRPTDTFTAKLKAQYGREREEGGLPIVRGGCPQPAPFPGPSGFCAFASTSNALPLSADFVRNTSNGQRTGLESQDYAATFSADWQALTLTSVTGYSHYDFALNSDLDTTPTYLLALAAPEEYRQVSQELRITSNEDEADALEYVAGVYYQNSDLDVTNQLGYGFLSPQIMANPLFQPLVPYLPFGIRDEFREEASTVSAFGALTWHATDRLSLTGAVRYTEVEKDFGQNIAVGTASPTFAAFVPLPSNVAPLGAAFAAGGRLATVGSIPLSRTDDHFSPSVSIQLDATDEIMLYARYDNGFKAGGFNGVDLSGNRAVLPFAPEQVDAFELGLKSTLPGARGMLNVALFRSDYENLQLAGVVPSTSGAYINRVQNAGGAVSQGVDIELTYRFTPKLRTSLTGTYLDAYYTEYPNATPTALQTVQGVPVQDLKGDPTPFAPKFSASLGITFETPLTASWTLRIDNQLFATSSVFLNFNNDPNVRQGSYLREDLTVALANSAGWELALVGKNLTDEVIRTYGAALPTSPGTYVFMTEPPRNVSLQLKYAF